MSKTVIGAGLMGASLGSGCLDILSYRYLGEVFPSAMTGNLALLGRGLGEGDAGATARNLLAFLGFFVGAALGAAMLRGTPGKVRVLLTLLAQGIVLGGFAVFWNPQADVAWRFDLIGAAAVGMGIQSAVAGRIGIHAVSTTYFTGTAANIAFGLVSATRPRRIGWPIATLCSYLAGAALAGWTTFGAGPSATAIGLHALPALTTALLAVSVAAARLDG